MIANNAIVAFEASNDGGTTWYAVSAVQRGTGAITINATSNGIYEINVAGFKLLRARISSYTSGGVTVYGDVSPFTFPSNSVQIFGRKETEIIVVSRAIRTTSYGPSGAYTTAVPLGATGCNIYANIYGVTGTFAAGEGISLIAYLYPGTGKGTDGSSMGSVTLDKQNTARNQLIIFDKGAVKGDFAPIVTNAMKVTGIPICSGQKIGYALSINGTFTEGQGFDCEVLIEWMY
jgi:hypothetical protein